jgi:hypothetical protein
MIKMEKLLDAAVAQYEEDYPIHLFNPMQSAISVMSESHFTMLTASEIQYILRSKHILITDCASQGRIQFDRAGLRTLCSPRDTIEVNGGFRNLFPLPWLIPGCRSVYPSGP